jgi:hypothetical protein
MVVNNKLKFTTEQFIKQLKKIHGNKYDYSKTVYNGIRNKIIIICKIHGEISVSAESHFKGSNCKFCFYNRYKYVKFLKQNNDKIIKNIINLYIFKTSRLNEFNKLKREYKLWINFLKTIKHM